MGPRSTISVSSNNGLNRLVLTWKVRLAVEIFQKGKTWRPQNIRRSFYVRVYLVPLNRSISSIA